MKRIQTLILLLAVTVVAAFGQTPEEWAKLEKSVNFYVANDLGRNGYYDQKPIAELMGRMAETVGIECVAAIGDVHHFEGVASTQDPLWMTNYELIYSHPELMLDWYPICGNHEYRGNTQAVLDYAKVSRRWMMPAKYYTKVIEDDDVTVRLVFVDWLDQTLTDAKEDWVIVLGHHPIYADTDKNDTERTDMQNRLNAVLLKHKNVAMYVCGHIHNFQHIRKPGTDIDYIVNTSGSLSRPKVKAVDGTQFCSGITGFSLVCADKQTLDLHLIDKDGKVVYTVSKKK